jgi:Flp pilus assembly protein TadD
MIRPVLRCLVAALLLPAGVRAQQPPPSEAEALRHKAAARYGEAVRSFLDLIDGLGAASDRRAAALAEYYAVMAGNLARRTGHWTELRQRLARALQSPLARSNPALRAALQVQDLQAATAAGDLSGIAEGTRALGFIETWWVIGPFDNERGGGFAQTFGPEQQLDLDASYDGKKRQVAWLRLPVNAPPGGVIDLDALVRPNDQVLCYAAACIESERDQPAVLHLGSDESFKVFCNGAEVGARDVRRRFAYDQDAVPLMLRRGANLLLLKICEQEGEFAFAARLAAPDGGPLPGATASEAPDRLRAAAATEPLPTAAAAEPFLGGRTVFAEQLAPNGDPYDALRLAYLLASRQPDDPGDRRDHRLAQRATDELPEETAARYLLAFTRIQPALHAAEKEENLRRRDYHTILEQDPEHVQALVELAGMELRNLGDAASAEALARRALRVNPDCGEAAAILAQSLQKLALRNLAREALTERAGPGTFEQAGPELVAALAEVLERENDLDGAIRAREYVLACSFEAPHVEALAALLLRRGRSDDAIALLQRAEKLLPFASGPRRKLAALYEARNQLAEAAATLRGWLAICPEDDGALIDLARLHGLAGETEKQRELLRSAVELNPNLKDERRYLEYLEADLRPFHADYEIAGDEILAADRGAPADAAAANDTHYYLLDQTVVRAYRNGTTSTYHHFVARILTDEGASRMGSYRVPHYWGEQRARLLEARVVKGDGSVQRPRLRGAAVTLPPLAPGDAVEIRARVDDLAPSYFGDYFGLQHGFLPNDRAPCARSELVLILDPGRDYRVAAKNGAPEGQRRELADGTIVLRHAMRDLPRGRIEEAQPLATETEPMVLVTTYRDWNQFSAWWWHLIRRQIQVSPAMQARVAELTAGKTGELDRIAAIYDFVTTEIRYTAWEFGVHGYKPYSTPVIFERRHGDCKDKALLLNAMLGEAGIEAYPVLIWADDPRSAADLSLPLIGHFNHCISYLPPSGDRPAMFLDGTATYHPPDTVPAMDCGAHVLVVKGPRGELHDVPWPEPDANVDDRELTVELRANGDARVELVQRPRLLHAVALREQLGNEPARRNEKLEERLGRTFGKVKIKDVQTTDLRDTARPVELRVAFDAPAFAARSGDGLVLGGALETRSLLPLARTPDRAYPLLLGCPSSERTIVRYRLPAGFAPAELPEPTQLETRFGRFTASWTFADGELRLERTRTLRAHRIEPPEYAEFREFATRAERADRQTLIVRKGGSR